MSAHLVLMLLKVSFATTGELNVVEWCERADFGKSVVASPPRASTIDPGTQNSLLVNSSSYPPHPTFRSASDGQRLPCASGEDHFVTFDSRQ